MSATRVGRPRSPEADTAILDAATDLFIELGWDGLTMEGVAARAGVGKATIYRRYPCKVDLLMAAAERIGEKKGPVPNTGTLRGDLRVLALNYRRMLTASDAGRAIPVTLAAASRAPEVCAAHRDYIRERRAESAVVLERAIERGELRDEADVGLVLDLLAAPLFYRVFVSGEPVDDPYLDSLTEAVVRACS